MRVPLLALALAMSLWGCNEPSLAPDAGGLIDGGPRADGGTPGPAPEDGGSRGTGRRILFDAAHRNVAGNAVWEIDTHSPDPSPAVPSSETSWNGGISAWAFDLYSSGRYVVRQLAPSSALNFGGGGPNDLRTYDVFITDEPERDFTAAEMTAMSSFIDAGGGLLLVSDHAGAVRCSGCIEAWKVLNALVVQGPASVFGLRFDGNDIGTSGLTGTASGTPLGLHFSQGPFGSATGLLYHSGSSVSVSGSNPRAEVVVTSSAGGMIGASEHSSGARLVVLGDSSPTDDGTCTSCSASLFKGWEEASNAHFILNATAWVAHDGS